MRRHGIRVVTTLPDDLAEWLTFAASASGRSLSQELLACAAEMKRQHEKAITK